MSLSQNYLNLILAKYLKQVSSLKVIVSKIKNVFSKLVLAKIIFLHV